MSHESLICVLVVLDNGSISSGYVAFEGERITIIMDTQSYESRAVGTHLITYIN